MAKIVDALFLLDGTISLGTYMAAWGVLIAASCVGLHVLTRGWCWEEAYGVDGPSARNLAIAIAAVSGALAYPTFAVATKALESTDSSLAWGLLLAIPTVVQPITQWQGLNGSFMKPTAFGMALSVAFLAGVVLIGVGL